MTGIGDFTPFIKDINTCGKNAILANNPANIPIAYIIVLFFVFILLL
jgi:hypothetical protein